MKKALIYLDPDALLASVELLGAVEQMYSDEGFTAYGVCLGSPNAELTAALDYLICIEDSRVEKHDILNLTNCIEELQCDYNFDAVLIPATTFGRMLAPRAAMRLHVGLVADVTGIRRRNDRVELVRPAFSGRMLAGIINQGAAPVMLSVRQNTFSIPRRKKSPAEIIGYAPRRISDPGLKLVSQEPKPATEDIRESEVLISGGGGVLRYFDRLEALAQKLNGKVSASRRVVDSGKAPRHIQVGQSGKTVSPRLYLALGISGSIQHVAGLKNAECIIAVNQDRHAPICSLSDLVVEGDARDFLEKMIKRIELDGSWNSGR